MDTGAGQAPLPWGTWTKREFSCGVKPLGSGFHLSIFLKNTLVNCKLLIFRNCLTQLLFLKENRLPKSEVAARNSAHTAITIMFRSTNLILTPLDMHSYPGFAPFSGERKQKGMDASHQTDNISNKKTQNSLPQKDSPAKWPDPPNEMLERWGLGSVLLV